MISNIKGKDQNIELDCKIILWIHLVNNIILHWEFKNELLLAPQKKRVVNKIKIIIHKAKKNNISNKITKTKKRVMDLKIMIKLKIPHRYEMILQIKNQIKKTKSSTNLKI